MLPPGTGSKKLDLRTKEKTGNFVFLAKDVEEILDDISKGIIKSDKQKRVLEFLCENDGVYSPDLEVLTEVTSGVFKTLEKNGFVEIVEKQIERNPFINKNITRDEKKVLNDEQKKCFDGINFFIENNEYSSNLIYGITGSGKTEIYMQLIENEQKRKEQSASATCFYRKAQISHIYHAHNANRSINMLLPE